MAESMILGTPVIATNWSANTEFMDENVACMVPAKVVELEHDYYPFRKGFHWADADVHVASLYMKKLFEDESFRKILISNAKEQAKIMFDLQTAGENIKRVLDMVRAKIKH